MKKAKVVFFLKHVVKQKYVDVLNKGCRFMKQMVILEKGFKSNDTDMKTYILYRRRGGGDAYIRTFKYKNGLVAF